MTKAQEVFIKFDNQRVEIKEFFIKYNEATENLVKELGIDGHFQDEAGVVYQAISAKGTYVEYKAHEIVRTKRLDEKKGSLSKVKAKELGYEL